MALKVHIVLYSYDGDDPLVVGVFLSEAMARAKAQKIVADEYNAMLYDDGDMIKPAQVTPYGGQYDYDEHRAWVFSTNVEDLPKKPPKDM